MVKCVSAPAWQPLRGGAQAQACILQFDAGQFDPRSFHDHGIACPPSVARGVPRRQAEFFAGRLAARHALARMQVGPCQLPIGPAREPVWPQGTIGSISHSRRYAAAVALARGRERGIGIDIEHIVTPAMQASLLATAVSASEFAYVCALDTALSVAARLTLVFSAKESLYKGAFSSVGRYFDFSEATLAQLDTERRTVSLCLTGTLSRDFLKDQVCRVSYDFIDPDTVLTSFIW